MLKSEEDAVGSCNPNTPLLVTEFWRVFSTVTWPYCWSLVPSSLKRSWLADIGRMNWLNSGTGCWALSLGAAGGFIGVESMLWFGGKTKV